MRDLEDGVPLLLISVGGVAPPELEASSDILCLMEDPFPCSVEGELCSLGGFLSVGGEVTGEVSSDGGFFFKRGDCPVAAAGAGLAAATDGAACGDGEGDALPPPEERTGA